MILGDDGGAEITYDGGQNWSTLMNQPTAQFYRVVTDDVYPYRIYGAQQDNSTVRIRSRSDGRAIAEADWEPTAGGESGWIAPDPRNPEVVYGGSYGGLLTRQDHATGQERDLNPWPDNPMGHGAEDLRERFQWNFPIVFSRHVPARLYAASQHLFATTNEGQSWTRLSGDLTRNDRSKMGPSGGPITKDNTSVEYYGTIFSFAEGRTPGVIWTGSDDGLVHVSRDDGATWTNVTPPASMLPEFAQINALDADPHRDGGLYVAATRYKWGDFAPYLYHTADYGRTWRKITRGIAAEHFTRVVRADPERAGMLWAGTENGLYLSMDDGAAWQPYPLNLPVVPVTDLAIKDGDLIVATQGRAFWVLDDVGPLRRYRTGVAGAAFALDPPAPAVRAQGGQAPPSRREGQNAPAGAVFRYRFAAAPDSEAVRLKVLDASGTVLATFSPKDERNRLPIAAGGNTLVWGLREAPAEVFPGLILWAGGTQGPRVMPGTYRARLVVGRDSVEHPFAVRADPRATATADDYAAQYAFLQGVRDKLERDAPRHPAHPRRARADQRRRAPPARRGRLRQREGAGPPPRGRDDRGGGGPLPDEEPRRAGPAQLPDPPQQPPLRARLVGFAGRLPAHRPARGRAPRGDGPHRRRTVAPRRPHRRRRGRLQHGRAKPRPRRRAGAQPVRRDSISWVRDPDRSARRQNLRERTRSKDVRR